MNMLLSGNVCIVPVVGYQDWINNLVWNSMDQ